MQRELQAVNGGFYAALDADSEGEEGKFYTWREEELKKLGYDVDEVIMKLQQNLLQGDLTLPEGLKRESFVDD